MKKEIKDSLVIGFALFAMFFGAGNLIFPPQLGFLTGTKWGITFFAFALTGIGMPILGIFAVGKAGGDIRRFAGKVHPLFADILGTVIMLGIGPLLAIPRTAATTYEIGVLPFTAHVTPLISSLCFFAIVLFFSIRPSKVINRIGKYLTPVLIAVLGFIIIRSVLFPIGVPQPPVPEPFFRKGFIEGYQTMDVLAAILFASIIIKEITACGYSDRKTLLKVNFFSGSIAAVCLLVVYGGLMYAGACSGSVFPADTGRTALLVGICAELWGTTGKAILAVCIAFACITTAAGLTATAGHYFTKLLKQKVSYEAVVVAVCAVSCWLAIYGVGPIVRYSIPLLLALYPVCILLILMNIADEYIPNRYYYIGGTIGTLLVSIPQAVIFAQDLVNALLAFVSVPPVDFEPLSAVLQRLPFDSFGLPWIVPALAGAVVFGIAGRKKSRGKV